MTSWIVLQLADSAFPSGGFAHSAGIEALAHTGELGRLEPFCAELVDQLVHGSLPIVGAAHDAPDQLGELDAFTRATLWNHVAARASRSQGRALLDIAARSFAGPFLVDARSQLGRDGFEGHLAPVYGAITRALDVTRDDALVTYLHLAVRGALSAAVRLNIVGPAEAQAIHFRLHPLLEAGLATARSLALDDVAQPSPIVELVQATHDRLYSRLFQS